MSGAAATFVVTAELDGASFGWLDDLRRAHFPAARNVLGAHLTLFHKLDAEAVAILRHSIGGQGAMPLQFSGVRFLGRGVAVEVAAPELAALRARCAAALAGRLTPQDRQPFRPHVTVQNKADPSVAQALHARLRDGFAERAGEARAILVWRYLGGPWQLAERLAL